MKILAIETSTEACSVALIDDDSASLIFRFEIAPREHTKRILPMMDEVLDDAGITLKEIDAMAFSCGPGAFTGLRIAAGVAQGAALSVDVPVVPVSTLATLAAQVSEATENDTIIAALDARMGEAYWGVFQKTSNELKALGEERVSQPQEMIAESKKYQNVIAIGPGWDAFYDEVFEPAGVENINYIKEALPSAKQVAQLAMPIFLKGDAVSAEDAQPVYIRNNVAKKSSKKVD